MIIQLVLSILLTILMFYALSQYRRSRPVSLSIIVCCLIGVVFVWGPSLSTSIANFLGVGRGADLVFYILAIITLAGIFNLHLRLRASHELLTELSRSIAISNVRKPK